MFAAAVIWCLVVAARSWPMEPEDEFDNWCLEVGHALYPNLDRDALFRVYVEQLIEGDTDAK